jgi:hypothetical protein
VTTERVVIVGGCRLGKSTLARSLGLPVFCGDPSDKVKDFERGVTYLPSGLGFGSESSQWIVDNWLPMPGPWVMEGHITARCLRKWMAAMQAIEESRPGLVMQDYPCDRVIVMTNDPWVELLPGQARLNDAVAEQWAQIAYYFESITEVR